jgi:hypothetical protein
VLTVRYLGTKIRILCEGAEIFPEKVGGTANGVSARLSRTAKFTTSVTRCALPAFMRLAWTISTGHRLHRIGVSSMSKFVALLRRISTVHPSFPITEVKLARCNELPGQFPAYVPKSGTFDRCRQSLL